MNVWRHWQTANHEPWLKVKRFAKGWEIEYDAFKCIYNEKKDLLMKEDK